MKRVIAILTTFFMLFPLMADIVPSASASFSLRFLCGTVLTQNIEVRFTDQDLTGSKAFPATSKSDDAGGSQMDFAIDADTTSDTVLGYITYLSNAIQGSELDILPSKLTSKNDKTNSYAIDYTLHLNDQTYNTATGGSMISIMIEPSTSTLVKIMKSFPLSIDSDGDSFKKAPQDDYSGTIIVYLKQS